jgi:hypothetical protein
MDIGKQKRVIQVEPEPLTAPVETPAEAEPFRVPANPDPEPADVPAPSR